jgi:antitoxin component YwqK of YwqJK toxin-antitoxin module
MVVACVAFLIFYFRPPSAPAGREATFDELVRREERLYRKNEDRPFTGLLVERYPNGSVKSRSVIVDGLLNGTSEGWYTNGQVEVREYFKAGISDGLRSKWHPNGSRLSETTIRDGQHDGTFRRWHENGQLAEEVEMKRGQPDGIMVAYYPSGFLKARTRMQNGQPVEQKFWSESESQPAPAAERNSSP